MAHDVFISHSAQDKPVADAVCSRLEARSIRCWVAPRDVPPGVRFAEAIVQAIGASRIMVLVFSGNSNKSSHVSREVERAVGKGIPILPLRIDDVAPSDEMEYYLAGQHWLDALTPPLEQHLGRLVDAVCYLLKQTEGDAVEAESADRTAEPPPQDEEAGGAATAGTDHQRRWAAALDEQAEQLLREDDPDGALVLVRRAVALDPKSQQLMERLSLLLTHMGAMRCNRAGSPASPDWAEGVRLLREAVAVNPANRWAADNLRAIDRMSLPKTPSGG